VETKGKSLEEILEILEGTKHTNVPDLKMIYDGIEDMVVEDVKRELTKI